VALRPILSDCLPLSVTTKKACFLKGKQAFSASKPCFFGNPAILFLVPPQDPWFCAPWLPRVYLFRKLCLVTALFFSYRILILKEGRVFLPFTGGNE
jgi:hypothetical protein